MKSTTDEEKAAVKSMKKNSLDLAYLYLAVDTIKVDGCIGKAFSDKLPEVISHKNGICYMKGLPSRTHCLHQS